MVKSIHCFLLLLGTYIVMNSNLALPVLTLNWVSLLLKDVI